MIKLSQNRKERYPTPANNERLQRLDRELMDGTKPHDYVYAVGRGLRIRVCVMRDPDDKFYATAQLGRAFRVEGSTPSVAFQHLTMKMRVYLATLPSAVREKVAAMRRVSELT